MDALEYLVSTLLQLLLLVFLLRLLLQLVRADFRNPVSQAIVRITNPLILPLRRVLPPIGRVDTASVVAVLLVELVRVAILFWLRGFYLPGALVLAITVVRDLVSLTLWTYFWAIFIYVVLGLIAPGGYSPVQSLLASLCEPVLRPFRRYIPSIPGLDLSPLWAGIAIQVLLRLI